MRKGEIEMDSINSVEDTKGNNGERGSLIISNLRMIWVAHKSQRTNLSIGHNCIISTNIRIANSRLRGNTQALYVLTKFNNSRFEFIFTSLVKNSPRLFTTIQAVCRAYETSKLYRDLKLRGAIIRDKTLILLPEEEVFSKVSGVWNLSSDQGNLGTFFITNVRLVWHANLAENFNVSIPYLQMKAIKIRDSKFGHALVIETSPKSGGYVLGFRVDPPEALDQALKEIKSLYSIYSQEPIFGVTCTMDERPADNEEQQQKAERQMDDVEIVETDERALDVVSAYYADDGSGGGGGAEGAQGAGRDVVFNAELGLAVERLKNGVTVEQLFQFSFE